MDTSRISFGEMIAGVSGILLFIFMFFGWFSPERAGFSFNAWGSFALLDILLFLAAVVAVALPVLTATGAMPTGLPAPPGRIVAIAGAVVFVLVLLRIIFPPDLLFGPIEADADREIGVYLGLLATAGIAFGGLTASRERATGAGPPA